jgi:phosphate uptake regulator
MVRKLMGLGIIEETPNRIVLQCSIDPSKFPLDSLMRRLYIIASTMHKESMQALIEGDLELAKDAAFREEEANTIYWLILRLLILAQGNRAVAEKIGLKDTLKIIGDRVIAKYLEGIADYSKIIALNVIDIGKYKTIIGKKATEILIQMSELAYGICQHAMNGVFTGDIKVLNNTMEMKNTIENSEQKLIRELPNQLHCSSENMYDAIGQIRVIAWSLVRIAEHGAMIAEIAMNRAIEKGSEICKYVAENLK